MPSRTWYTEGHAEYFSYTVQHATDEQGAFQNHVRAQQTLTMFVRRDRTLAACVLPLQELVQITSYGDALEHMDRRAQANGHPSLSLDVALQFLYRGSHTWMHYLHEGAGALGREAVFDYIGRVQLGQDPAESFTAIVSDELLVELNEGYLEHLEELGMSTDVVQSVRATF